MNRTNTWVTAGVLAAITVSLFLGTGTAMERLNVTVAYATTIIILAFALVILVNILSGRIDISQLLTEAGGGASMSRFQLLVFTLVVALCLVLMVVANHRFPEIPKEVLELLGVSATTYAVSKGIQAGGMPSKAGSDAQKEPTTPKAD